MRRQAKSDWALFFLAMSIISMPFLEYIANKSVLLGLLLIMGSQLLVLYLVLRFYWHESFTEKIAISLAFTFLSSAFLCTFLGNDLCKITTPFIYETWLTFSVIVSGCALLFFLGGYVVLEVTRWLRN